ncbi:MAG: hypothetical protein LBJ08_06505 [Bifidobacteriaceae bacterium]|nr:hypothetical protein [Bifidobacteriaceae bacterium]
MSGAKFAGFGRGVLLEAKGPGYARFVRDGKFESWFTGPEDFLGQADRQEWAAAAVGSPIRWCFAEEGPADSVRAMFKDQNSMIEVLHVPFVE